MPYWRVNRAIARDLFGVESSDVDRLIAAKVRSVRRRMPGKSSLPGEICGSGILAYHLELYYCLEKFKNEVSVLRYVSEDRRRAKVFLLHTILGLLWPRLLALETTHLPIDKYGKNIVEAVKTEMRGILANFNPIDIPISLHSCLQLKEAFKEILIQLPAMLNDIYRHPTVRRQLARDVKWRMRYEECMKNLLTSSLEGEKSAGIGNVLPLIFSKQYRVTIGKDEIVFQDINNPNRKTVIKGDKCFRILLRSILRGRRMNSKDRFEWLMDRVSRFSATHSRLLDLFLLAPFTIKDIYYFLLDTDENDLFSTLFSLGTNVLKSCKDQEDDETLRRKIIDMVDSSWRSDLKEYNIPLLEGCAETYADTFIAGYKLVKSITR
ncbi:hypothetical protein [Staphylothermus hellenicus]|uniref:hypothetical protein n=1 Tax=Staphylothermus hellenicus TaxID=84599 RepID=UPI00069A70D8|nr:hypothetical protein [Staphylothermus hellenicus]